MQKLHFWELKDTSHNVENIHAPVFRAALCVAKNQAQPECPAMGDLRVTRSLRAVAEYEAAINVILHGSFSRKREY
jgi:hypothetical protein